jgi:quercetin dioxygenase-like cupin family protein
MANIKDTANKPKTEDGPVQQQGVTHAKIPPANLVSAGHGIPVDLGPAVGIELLTLPNEDNYWVMKGTLQPGANVPLHSHEDAEDFFVLSGEAEALLETSNGLEWRRVQKGDFIHIPGNLKHAWRNRFSTPSEQIVVTSSTLGRFLREMGEVIRAGGKNGGMEKLRELSARYGYWFGSPEENAAVGISLPQ